MKKVRVLIVEDSPVVRELLNHIIGGDPRFEVAAAVASGEEALRFLETEEVDVISMDIRLPGIDGFEATREVMSRKPTPIVVVSASVESDDLNISMNALRAGALSIVEKPTAPTHRGYEALAVHIRTQLLLMSRVKVVRQRGGAAARPATASALPPEACTASARERGAARMVGVAASTGGPGALVTLFEGLGAGFGLPILLVQHITPSFVEGFVSWLNAVCPQEVVLARPGEVPAAGRIHVAPADRHLALNGGRLQLSAGEPVSGQRPSGTVLFRSMARSLGPGAVGVLLTGMGEDGAKGLLEIRNAGGHTIAEDASTAVVHGMPRVAAETGAAVEVLPLTEIARGLLKVAGLRDED